MILISVDDHIVEPPDMFKNHLQKRYLDEAPRLVHNADGSDTWQFRDVVIPNVALNAVAGRPKEEYGLAAVGCALVAAGIGTPVQPWTRRPVRPRGPRARARR